MKYEENAFRVRIEPAQYDEYGNNESNNALANVHVFRIQAIEQNTKVAKSSK